MKRRHLAPVLVVAIWLLALAAVLKISLDQLLVAPWGNPIAGTTLARLSGDTEAGQRFVAPLPGLYRIEVTLAVPEGGISAPVVVHLQADPSSAEDLHRAEFGPGEVLDRVAITIEFPPIRDSEDRAFFFYVESPASSPANAPSALYRPDAVLEAATAYLNGEPVEGNLQFRTYYSLRTRERATLLLSRLAEGRPYFLGTRGFYVVFLSVYGALLLLFLYQIGKVISQESDRR
jgi:hypothetical protein